MAAATASPKTLLGDTVTQLTQPVSASKSRAVGPSEAVTTLQATVAGLHATVLGLEDEKAALKTELAEVRRQGKADLALAVKHAQSLADHCARLEAALSHARSKLPRVRQIATQTDCSFLSDVHADRNSTDVQRYVEHNACPLQ